VAQQVYISSSEIEQEPDGDSDDTDVVQGNYQSNKPGNMAVAMDTDLNDELAEYGAQKIAQTLQTDLVNDYGSGVTLSSTYGTQSNGDFEQVVKDGTGTVVNDIELHPDGSTDDWFYGSPQKGNSLGGGYWDTSVADVSDTGTPTINTLEFNTAGTLTATDFINPDGTSTSTTWTTNADGSQSFLRAAPENRDGTPIAEGPGTSEPSADLENTFWDGVKDYAIDKVIEVFKDAPTSAPGSQAVRVAANVIDKALTTISLGKQTIEAIPLFVDLYHEIEQGKDVSVTATELSARVAIAALTLTPFSPFADAIVRGNVALGNLVAGAAMDAWFEWKDKKNAAVVEQSFQHTQHTSIPLNAFTAGPDGTAVSAGSGLTLATAATSAAVSPFAQRALYSWAGLDTAAYAGVQFPGVGVQDLTANRTSVVLAASPGGTTPSYNYTDNSGHNLKVTAAQADLSSTTGAGNDTFIIAAPSQHIDGGDGTNSVVFSGNRGDYRIAQANGTIYVEDKNGERDGIDTLKNIQTLTFADGTSVNASAAATITATNTVGVFRFFDTHNGTHFFTNSASEVANVQATRPDLTYEGAGFQSQNTGNHDPNDTPVYRFFDTVFGTHFYTASQQERDQVQQTRPDLTYEGVGFTEHATLQGGDQAVYRFFDSVHGTHFYTNSDSERASILSTRPDLKDEGVGFYAPSYQFG
jgi:hypothetical protein